MANSTNSSTLLDTSGLAGLQNAKVALVYTEWNDKVVDKLILGCEQVLTAHKAEITHRVVVPGCVEIPFACKQLWEYTRAGHTTPEAIITFGTVIRGDTAHFDYVCQAVTDGITQLNLILPIPTIFGILTLENEHQAWERVGGAHGHKGEEAAIAALKMIKNSRSFKP